MDIKLIRENPDYVRNNQIKRYKDPSVVDNILSVDTTWKNKENEGSMLRSLRNKLSANFKTSPETATVFWDDIYTIDKLIENLLKGHVNTNVFIKEQLKVIVRYINDKLDIIEVETSSLLKKRNDLIAELGNKLYEKCIINDNEENNGIVYEHNVNLINELNDKYLDHIVLLDKLGFADTENGSKVAGNRGYFLTGFGVRLNQALITYALDFLEQHKYKLMETPHFVTGDLMSQISQLSDYQETLYKTDGYDKYLIATSEQPLTAYFNNKNISDDQLPIRFAGLSHCYRKEAGANAHHVRGIFRVHQFQKVEQFCVSSPDKSWELFDQMINIAKEFYSSLGLIYRVVNIVSGALNNAAAMKYDLEAYYPGSKQWCELVSCTNVLDYFPKRLNLKGNHGEYLHMLNCTLMANTRTICALVESYQTKDGFIVPDVLKPYLNGKDFIPFSK